MTHSHGLLATVCNPQNMKSGPSVALEPLLNKSKPDAGGSGFQIFVEPIKRVLPGFFCCRFVVTRGRVVVEAVIGALVDMTLMRHVVGGERRIKGFPSAGDALVELAILRIDGRLDLGGVFSA